MIFLDLETRSGVDLNDVGVYRYVEDPDFTIQLLSYSYDEGEVITLDLTRVPVHINDDLKRDLLDPQITKVAHNSQFERICLSAFFGMSVGNYIAPTNWICTMTYGLYRGFPASLEGLGAALGLAEGEAKIKDGKRLIRLFAVIHEDKQGRRYFVEPDDEPEDWAKYKEYNNQDVVAERAIYYRLVARGGEYGEKNSKLWKEFWLSESINDRGVRIDIPFVRNVVKLEAEYKKREEKKFLASLQRLAKLRGIKPDFYIDVSKDLQALTKIDGFSVNTAKSILKNGFGLFGNGVVEESKREEYEAAVTTIAECKVAFTKIKKEFSKAGQYFVNDPEITDDYQEFVSVYGDYRTRYLNACSILADMFGLSDLDININSIQQLCKITGLKNINKETVSEALSGKLDLQDGLEYLTEDPETVDLIKEIVEFRDVFGKTSVTKYTAMLNSVNSDGRVRGLFRFGGAGQTLRYAGRLVQLQNLSKNHYETQSEGSLIWSDDINELKKKIIAGDLSVLDRPNFIGDLSQLVRPSLIPAEGCVFAVADFSAIEARVLSWLADEQWRIDAFKNGKDIYCETASQMFKVPVVKHGENGELRAKGKVAELACGYGGGVGALLAFGADKMGMSEEEMSDVVQKWRESSPNVIKFWYALEGAVKMALLTYKSQKVKLGEGEIEVSVRSVANSSDSTVDLCIELPCGRLLFYNDAEIYDEQGFERTGACAHNKAKDARVEVRTIKSIKFKGVGLNKKICEKDTYSGKLVENVTQALARDILQNAMTLLDQNGYHIVAHIHDEVIVEIPNGPNAEEELNKISSLMAQNGEWFVHLPLRADGYLCNYYMKD